MRERERIDKIHPTFIAETAIRSAAHTSLRSVPAGSRALTSTSVSAVPSPYYNRLAN
jgi:hypothetical protein